MGFAGVVRVFDVEVVAVGLNLLDGDSSMRLKSRLSVILLMTCRSSVPFFIY